ncbi:MAG: hypothetical protein IK057_02000 [Clostridia bacterium]|nr:hypothetical protein [Clostridia bacterium]
MEPSNLLVVGLGVGTVFFGLVSLIVICMVMSAVCKLFIKDAKKAPVNEMISNKQEILAAACAVIAEEIGTEAKNIKVVSFKKI